VLGKLLVVRGENDGNARSSPTSSLRQLAQHGAALLGDAPHLFHLHREARIVRRKPKAVGRVGDMQRVAFFNLQAREHVLRQDHADGVSIRVSLRAAMGESDVITDVIIPPPSAGFKPPQALISFRGAWSASAPDGAQRVDPERQKFTEYTTITHKTANAPASPTARPPTATATGHDDPPGAASRFSRRRLSCECNIMLRRSKEDLDATTPTVYARRPVNHTDHILGPISRK